MENIYRPQTKFAKVMFSQVSVCTQGGSQSLSGGVSIPGVSVPWGLCPGGSLGGSLGGSVSKGGLCPGEPLSKGSLSRESMCGGVSCHRDPPYDNERALRILLEYILVINCFTYNKLPTCALLEISSTEQMCDFIRVITVH